MKILMTLLGLMGVLLLACPAAAQRPIERFQSFDARNSSGQVLQLVTGELKRAHPRNYESMVARRQEAIYGRHSILGTASRNAYLQDIDRTVARIQSTTLPREPLLLFDAQILEKFAIEPLRRTYQRSPGDYLNQLVAPALRAGFHDYVRDNIALFADTLFQERVDVDSLVFQAIGYLQATGMVLVTTVTETELAGALSRAIRQGTDSIAAMAVIRRLASTVKNTIGNGLPALPNTINANQWQAGLQQAAGHFTSSLQMSTQHLLSNLGNYINELANNEIAVQQSIAGIYQDWKEIEVKIVGIQRQLNGATATVAERAEHARLVAQNYLRLDVISRYVNFGAKAIEVVSAFKSGLYASVFNPVERQQFLDRLTSFDLPTLTETINGVASAVGFLASQFPNSRAVKEVTKFVNYAMAAINVGRGVAELFAGNPMGVISIIGGLKSLFGGAPQESPEMQLLRQMMDYLQHSFNAVFEHLEYIEKQLENLTILVQDMYRDMIRSFRAISEQLNRIERREQVLDTRTHQLLYAKLNLCQELESVRLERKRRDSAFMTRYKDYGVLYTAQECEPCLKALYTYTIRQNLQDYVAVSSTQEFNLSDIEVHSIYNPTRDLFKRIYRDNLAVAMNALTVPTRKLKATNQLFAELVQDSTVLLLPIPANSLDTYYDYRMLETLTHLLITYGCFAEIGDQNFKPKKLEEYLGTDPAELDVKRIGLRNRLLAVLDLVEKALLQQNILSGNLLIESVYQILLGYNPHHHHVDSAVSVLQNNGLLAKNFASRLLYGRLNYYGTGDSIRYQRFSSLYYGAKTSVQSLEMLNAEFGTPVLKFAVDNTNLNIFLRLMARGREIRLSAPEPAFVLSNEMIQSDGAYALLKARQQLIDRIIDLNFLSDYQSSTGLSTDDLKYIYEPF